MRRVVFRFALGTLVWAIVWRVLLGGWEPSHDIQYLCEPLCASVYGR